MVVKDTTQSRRSVLKRALLVGAGAIGLGAAADKAGATMPLQLEPNHEPDRELRLHGRNWRLETAGRKPGEPIQLGDNGAVHGELLDGPKGTVLGQFFGSRLAIQAVAGPHPRANGGIEVHTFVLPGGTILGMGTSLPGASVFAVVGGTGVYAGAHGSYVATQRLREQGGNGTAEFNLTLRA